MRSEEHTSELQSHSDLVCRLLLTPTTEIYTLSLHDALPISHPREGEEDRRAPDGGRRVAGRDRARHLPGPRELADGEGDRLRRMDRTQPPRGRRARSRGDV